MRHYSPGEKRHSRGPMTRYLLELVTLGTRLEPQRDNSRLVGKPEPIPDPLFIDDAVGCQFWCQCVL
jgi:hypothetical protein